MSTPVLAPRDRADAAQARRHALWAAAAYALCALAWILLSDTVLAQAADMETVRRISQAKGLAFVAVTSIAFYLALRAAPTAAALREQLARGALERSQAQLRSYAEHAPMGVLLLDTRGGLVEANGLAYALAGRDPAQPWPRPADDLRIDGKPLKRSASRRLLREGKWQFDAQLQRQDGRLCWVEISVARVAPDRYTAFVQDVTERRREERALRQALALFRNTTEGLIITDPKGVIVTANPAFCQATGYAADELVGANMSKLSSGRHDAAFYRRFWRELLSAGFWQGEMWNRRKNGEVYPEWLTVNAVRGPDGELQNFVAACTDITRSKASEMELERLAHHDALTDLPNRLLMMTTLEQALARARRSGTHGAVLILDLDRFQNVNDSLGHPAGDELLQQAAARVRQRLRASDTVARLGGDEFVVLLEGLEHPERAGEVAQALIEACNQPFLLGGGHEACVGASVGISLFPDDSTDCDRLMQQADAALYSAKGGGKGTFRFFTGAYTREAQSRLDMESGLRRALEERQFSLVYQPLVQAATGHIQGMEALVRWHHPERGTVSPATFIPLAEETGLIVPLGEWVLRTACEQLKRWQAEGIAPQMVAVNLSPRQFAQPRLVDQVAQVLADTGLAPQCLELEITEGALMDATDAGLRLQALKALSVKLAIDDFGTGYSSLAYLSRFPLDKLKIDQSFVRRIPDDATDMEITTAVIQLAKSLDLRVLAEGVETQAQVDFLLRQGCELFQGYLFSRPVPAEEAGRLLRKQAALQQT